MILKQQVLQTIRKYRLFKPGDKVLVAVSGGPDSLALLHVLLSLKKELGISFAVAHINHKLRKSADGDMRFVENICAEFGLTCVTKTVNLKAEKTGSLEQTARQARLKFFLSYAHSRSYDRIALGHSKDDQAETVLMRILRGSGLYGLNAIMPVRVFEGVGLVRPLLESYRVDVDRYLKKIKLNPRIDETNTKGVFFRNKIRLSLLPFIEKNFSPSVKDNLSRLAQVTALDYEYLNSLCLKQYSRLVTRKGLRIVFDLEPFNRLHESVKRMFFRIAVKDLLGSTRKFDLRHWQEVYDLLSFRPVGSIVDLPRNLSVKKEQKFLLFYIRNY